jgi:phosphoadenosine phosphosulfate reductase
MIKEILEKTKNYNWQEKLEFVTKNFSDIVFSTSFSLEDQIITDFIAKNNLPIEIFTIDTARLPEETHATWQSSLEKYKIKISVYYPNQNLLAEFVTNNGINAFYESVDKRKNCCAIRKIEPLKRALENKNLWISGVRKEHSLNRNNKEFFEIDEALKLTKFYPLLETSESDLWKYIEENRVPFNRLYKKGYSSIGCSPCSRAVKEGDDIRAGRWWWENDDVKECGLHK